MTAISSKDESLSVFVSDSAAISAHTKFASSVKIWNFAQIRENVTIGHNSIIGSYVYIDSNVQIGNNCKIQNRALIYEPAKIEDGVFIGPGAILTNDRNPRSVQANGDLKSINDWTKVGVVIEMGASIGAGAICIAPIHIGSWAMVGAGAVVTKDVPAFAVVVGNPARQIGWVGKNGNLLQNVGENEYRCTETMVRYIVSNGELEELEIK
jgi:UDP-2-acetamido-3-amino-2,3-dideoxy-glucuronate N-acetyltransferase